MSRDEKRKILVDGKAKMPAYAKKVAAAEIDPLLDYSLGLVAGKAAPAAPAPAADPKPAPKPAPKPEPATPAPAPAAGAAAAPASAPGGPSTATKTLWTKRCASCHGPDGAGNAKMAKKLKIEPALLDLGREATADLSRGDFAAIIRTGKDKMPAFAKKLKGAQIMALTDHTFTLASERRAKK
jgi:mono/diheme cytochrome c family protein